MISAIAFDGNGVLYYRSGDLAEDLVAFAAESFAPRLDRAAAAAGFRAAMAASFDGKSSKAAAVAALLDGAGILEPEARSRVEAEESRLSSRIELFPTERETLLSLRARGIPMGMVTNTYQGAAEKARWLAALGLAEALPFIVSSIDFGAAKPDPAIYLEFARLAGIAPAEVLFVGHEDFELRGAERAGMLTAAFNCPATIKADYRLREFSDLLAIASR